MEAGTKVKVKSSAPHHAGRVGYFKFYGEGPSKGTAVIAVEAPSAKANPETLFAVANGDFFAVSVGETHHPKSE